MKQNFTNWELLISDDGSTDSTASTVQSFQKSHGLPEERCRYIQSPNGNRGVSVARNRASRLARGRWLAFLDSDDEWLAHKLSRQLALADDHLLVHGEETWIRDGQRVNPKNKHAKSGGWLFRRCVDLCCISPSAALIRRDWFLGCGGFREDFPVCEDYDLWLRLCSRFPVAFVNEPVLIKYGGHQDQLSRRYKAMDYFRVKALASFLDDNELKHEDRAYVAQQIQRKCRVLLNGYRKHHNFGNYREVEGWSLKAFTQLQIAPSAPEGMPRSDDSFNL